MSRKRTADALKSTDDDAPAGKKKAGGVERPGRSPCPFDPPPHVWRLGVHTPAGWVDAEGSEPDDQWSSSSMLRRGFKTVFPTTDWPCDECETGGLHSPSYSPVDPSFEPTPGRIDEPHQAPPAASIEAQIEKRVQMIEEVCEKTMACNKGELSFSFRDRVFARENMLSAPMHLPPPSGDDMAAVVKASPQYTAEETKRDVNVLMRAAAEASLAKVDHIFKSATSQQLTALEVKTLGMLFERLDKSIY